ncbi:MAG: class 1b ribonucleoside-diphosphate reductase subunit alpha, partial [Turicibacter sp.]|nr:class 1b ribonucleoside-diphosphate reductase subunit alpha [Turicibacter sp.]
KKDNFYQLQKDREAVELFLEEVELKFNRFESEEARLRWLIDENYYEDFLKQYKLEAILKIREVVFSYQFKFQSFMAVSKFYKDYALKTNDHKNYLEYYEDRIVAVALYLAQGDVNKALEYAIAMIEQRYQPATPTFLNAGKARRGEMVSCFLLEMDDSLNSITYNLNTSMQLSKIGGGVALNLSKLRARNESIKGIEQAASGVLPVMKLLEDSFSYVNQLGQRPGAGAAYLNIFHWDIEEFLDTKKINADEKSRIQTLSIGVVVPSKFFELAKKNEPMYVFAPYTVYQALGQHLDDLDLDERYEELIQNDAIKKRPLDARRLLTHIAKMQFESGYPYMVFKSNANAAHALKGIGQIKMSNLCTEIFQLQETSEIKDYGEESEIRRDISCNLGSLNIVNVMEKQAIKESVYSGMDALTSVSDLSLIPNAPGINKANHELHAVGLGCMNLHGFLAKNKIAYESDLAKEFVRTFFMMVNYYSIERSMQIACEKGQRFVGFEQSDYANGTYFKRYQETDYTPVTSRIKSLFGQMRIPTSKDWSELAEAVKDKGIYHAYRLAIAPTQSIGYVQNATASVLPIVDLVERRTYGNSTTYYPMPYLAEDNLFFYKSAYRMDMMKVLELIAQIQPHIDQGISTTLYVDSHTSTRELVRYYLYAHHLGLKSLYYTRTKNLSFEECLTCSV